MPRAIPSQTPADQPPDRPDQDDEQRRPLGRRDPCRSGRAWPLWQVDACRGRRWGGCRSARATGRPSSRSARVPRLHAAGSGSAIDAPKSRSRPPARRTRAARAREATELTASSKAVAHIGCQSRWAGSKVRAEPPATGRWGAGHRTSQPRTVSRRRAVGGRRLHDVRRAKGRSCRTSSSCAPERAVARAWRACVRRSAGRLLRVRPGDHRSGDGAAAAPRAARRRAGGQHQHHPPGDRPALRAAGQRFRRPRQHLALGAAHADPARRPGAQARRRPRVADRVRRPRAGHADLRRACCCCRSPGTPRRVPTSTSSTSARATSSWRRSPPAWCSGAGSCGIAAVVVGSHRHPRPAGRPRRLRHVGDGPPLRADPRARSSPSRFTERGRRWLADRRPRDPAAGSRRAAQARHASEPQAEPAQTSTITGTSIGRRR